MRGRKHLVGAAAVALSVLATAAPAGAASETHLTGEFTGITSENCSTSFENPDTWGPVTGTWRINVGQHTASARFVIDLAGAPHVAYTAPLAVVSRDGSSVVATTDTAAGPLTVTVSGSSMTYVIAPYDSRTFPDHRAYCPQGSVTYLGRVTTAG